MAEGLMKRELEAARQVIETQRHHARNARGLTFLEKMADTVIADGSPPMRSPKDKAQQNVAQLERLYADVAAPLPNPKSLSDVEGHIRSTNQDIVAAANAYEPFSDPMEMEQTGVKELDVLLFAFKVKDAVEQPAGFVATDALITPFTGLQLYKVVMYSHLLQDKREGLISGYLKEASQWDRLRLKSEIRKRNTQLEAVPTVELPVVDLFTTRQFRLTDPFRRQHRFLTDVVSDLETAAQKIGEDAHLRTKSTAEIREIIDKEKEIKNLIDVLRPSEEQKKPEDRFTEHVERVTHAIKDKLRMKQAEEEMLKQYPSEYHWYIKRQFRTALEELN